MAIAVWVALLGVCLGHAKPILTTVPSPLTETALRGSTGSISVHPAIIIEADATNLFILEAMRYALPAIFQANNCTPSAGSGPWPCDRGFASRMKALLETPGHRNVQCQCNATCSNPLLPCRCHNTPKQSLCQKIRIELQHDRLYDISSDEQVSVSLPPFVFQQPPWGGPALIGSFAIRVAPGRLFLRSPTGGLVEELVVEGRQFAAGGTVVTLVLEGESWVPPFTLSAMRSNWSKEDQPQGIEARKEVLFPTSRWGPTNQLQLPVQRDDKYTATAPEVISICGDERAKSLVRSGLLIENSGLVKLRLIPPFPAVRCQPPRTADCMDCLPGFFGDKCQRCPTKGGNVCGGHGDCKQTNGARCHHGCRDGKWGTGRCTCLAGYDGESCSSMTPVAIAGTSTTTVAASSLLFEIAAGGSPAAPITSITQLQLLVLLGAQRCTPSKVRELAQSVTWVVNPFYGPIHEESDPEEDTAHMWQSYAILSTLFFLHLLVLAVVWVVKSRRSGWTLRDCKDFVYFPSLQFLSILLLLFNSISSSSAVLSHKDPSPSVIAMIGAALLLVFYFAVFPAYLIHLLLWRIGRNRYAGKPCKAEYLSRNVANSAGNAVRVVYTSKRAESMPVTLVYFLPLGFWSSLHLPDRGFCRRYGILYDEYRDVCHHFLVFQYLKLCSYATVLGVRRDSEEGCKKIMWALLVFVILYALVLSWFQPYSSRGSNILHSLVAWCNAGVVASIIAGTLGGGESFAHAFLLLSSCLVILCAVWNILVFVLGRTVYRVKHTYPTGGDCQEMVSLSRSPHTVYSNDDDCSAVLACAASHVSDAELKLPGDGWSKRWCELRGDNLVYFKDVNDAQHPKGWIDVTACTLLPELKKKKLKLSSTVGEEMYGLRCDEEGELDCWYKAIQAVASQASCIAADEPLFSQRSLDVYTEGEVLGVGAFGEVVKVIEKPTGQSFAMKKLVLRKGDDYARILNETAILQLLQHPYIVKLHEAFRDSSTVFLVMAMLSGGDFAQHLQHKGTLTVEQAQFFSAEVLLALEHMHANSILYRDLKPSNIVLDQPYGGHAVLTDMGIAAQGLTSNTFCGTPYYLSPEVLKYRSYNQAVDWWAFGVVLYEFLVGTTPFAAEEQSVTFQLIEMKNPTFPSAVPESARGLISKLLVKKPADRLVKPKKIRRHPFFKGINWTKLSARECEPPEMQPLCDDGSLSLGADSPVNTPHRESSPLVRNGLQQSENPIESMFRNGTKPSSEKGSFQGSPYQGQLQMSARSGRRSTHSPQNTTLLMSTQSTRRPSLALQSANTTMTRGMETSSRRPSIQLPSGSLSHSEATSPTGNTFTSTS